MNSTPHDPRPSDPEDENTVRQPDSAADTPDGLADPETAERFHQAVEHRLSQATPKTPGTQEQAPDTDPDDDNPVSIDNPE